MVIKYILSTIQNSCKVVADLTCSKYRGSFWMGERGWTGNGLKVFGTVSRSSKCAMFRLRAYGHSDPSGGHHPELRVPLFLGFLLTVRLQEQQRKMKGILMHHQAPWNRTPPSPHASPSPPGSEPDCEVSLHQQTQRGKIKGVLFRLGTYQIDDWR